MKSLENCTEPELMNYIRCLQSVIKTVSGLAGFETPQYVLLLTNDPRVLHSVTNLDAKTAVEVVRVAAQVPTFNCEGEPIQ